MDFDDVAELAADLPDTNRSTSYGTPALKVRKKLLCRMWPDDEVLVLRTDDEEKEALIQGDPAVFFSTDHYDGHPYVLVRLDQADPVELSELLAAGWHEVATPTMRKAFDG
ncbi:MAG: MmcQ/YjbR family DNA-binding protein [Acidimicrobiales bacterium]